MKKSTKKTRRNPLWAIVQGQAEASLKPKVERDRSKYTRKVKHK